MTECERWEELLSQDIPVMVKAPFTGEPMCIDLLQFGTAELESLINFLVSHGAILPPCKIGDTVWIVFSLKSSDKEEWFMTQDVVQELMYGLNGFFVETRKMRTYPESKIGKTVFLTREEAEAELEKRRKEVNTT